MHIRRAVEGDLPGVLRLLFQDRATTSDELPPDAPCYAEALREMQASAWNGTWVAEVEGRLAGTFMLTFIRHLLRRGGLVAQLEAVRIDAPLRGRGHGAAMMRWIVEECRRRGCARIQLTSNKSRKAAHRFYQRLGFVASHEGMKLDL
ncbi:MAG TPA: GNAT family N-acetyltransferase [Myxococcales bacterium]|nr:GNAT family N-acetyltransferase [Myxococcales bacterium]